MRLYYVEPPREEVAGDGEDTREWFGSLREARSRFVEWKRMLRQDWKNRDEPTYAYYLVGLYRIEVPTTKPELIETLNRGLGIGAGAIEIDSYSISGGTTWAQ